MLTQELINQVAKAELKRQSRDDVTIILLNKGHAMRAIDDAYEIVENVGPEYIKGDEAEKRKLHPDAYTTDSKKQWNTGLTTLKHSIKFIFKKPIFLVPLIIAWILSTSIILYVRYYFEFGNDFTTIIVQLYLIIFAVSTAIILGNLVMLELIQQTETGKKVSLSKALGEALFRDFAKALPLSALWAFMWTLITIIKALLSRANKNNRPSPSARDAAYTLAGASSPFSWWRISLNLFEKGIRMFVFMALPAIAWEELSSLKAMKKSKEIIKTHPSAFLSAYGSTLVTTMLMAIPLVLVIWYDKAIGLPNFLWTYVIIYECIAWSFSIYLEQMTVALLYMWHLKWVKKGSKGKIKYIKPPSLLDEINDLTA